VNASRKRCYQSLITPDSSNALLGTVDRPFHQRILVANYADGYSAYGLPPGLEVNPVSGLITGSPRTAGTYLVTLFATNAVGVGQRTVTLNVNLPLPGLLTSGPVIGGLGIGSNLKALQFVNEPDWVGVAGLPPGLLFDPKARVISGVPLEVGEFEVSFILSNRYGLGSGSLKIQVHSVVIGWGRNASGECDMPSVLSKVVAIAAGNQHSLALTDGGQVVAWGKNVYGQANIPSGLSNVVSIAAGAEFSLALTADGRVVGWGLNSSGQTNIPSGLSNVVALAGGNSHSLVLTVGGQVVAWGRNDFGQTNVPPGLSNV
jgi:hypothetical protein